MELADSSPFLADKQVLADILGPRILDDLPEAEPILGDKIDLADKKYFGDIRPEQT